MVEQISFKLGLVGELFPYYLSFGGHLRWKGEGFSFGGKVLCSRWWEPFFYLSEETIFFNDVGEKVGRFPGDPWLAAFIEVDMVQPKSLAVTRGAFKAINKGMNNVRMNIH